MDIEVTLTGMAGVARILTRDRFGRFTRAGAAPLPPPIRGAGGRFVPHSFSSYRAPTTPSWSSSDDDGSWDSGDEGGGGEGDSIEYVIGTTLPYASHWIEEGWRERGGEGEGKRIYINYHTPPAGGAWFVEKAANRYTAGSSGYDDDAEAIGAFLSGEIGSWALDQVDNIIQLMQSTLQTEVYNQTPYNPDTKRRWTRQGHDGGLIASIQAYRRL